MPTNISFSDSLEKIPVEIFKTPKEGSHYVAELISVLIREKNAQGKKAVIGLATGSTPKSLYAELVRMHNEEGLSFKNVITFNLDQYYPIGILQIDFHFEITSHSRYDFLRSQFSMPFFYHDHK